MLDFLRQCIMTWFEWWIGALCMSLIVFAVILVATSISVIINAIAGRGKDEG